jgi:dipeptidase E
LNAELVAPPKPRILAIGGGGFLMEDGPSPIDRYVLRLTGQEKPRICFVGTPSGDLPEHVSKFYTAFDASICTRSHLAFFRPKEVGSLDLFSLQNTLLEQDVIYVGPGNTRAALAVWRNWGVDQILKQAYSNGVLMCGMSAGAMCWFEQALTDSYWQADYEALPGLGFLAGACGVHYQSDPMRQERLLEATRLGKVVASIAIDDEAAVLFENGALTEVVAWRADAAACRVSNQCGRVVEDRLPATLL